MPRRHALLKRAEVEARHLGHDAVTTGHVVLAALGDPADALGALLLERGCSARAMRHVLVTMLQPGRPPPAHRLPFSPDVREALEEAARTAGARGAPRVEAHDILSGLRVAQGGRSAPWLRGLRLDPV